MAEIAWDRNNKQWKIIAYDAVFRRWSRIFLVVGMLVAFSKIFLQPP